MILVNTKGKWPHFVRICSVLFSILGITFSDISSIHNIKSLCLVLESKNEHFKIFHSTS